MLRMKDNMNFNDIDKSFSEIEKEIVIKMHGSDEHSVIDLSSIDKYPDMIFWNYYDKVFS